jgi:succinate dehydrogenase/fumarate reductase flavoprotein subunit
MDWNELVSTHGLPKWPYPIRYGREREVHTDVLVLGGGIAGCWAAISAARRGVKVVLVEKAATLCSGAGGTGCDHWVLTPNPQSEITAEEVVDIETEESGGYTNAISRYIAARESYDTLLELEQMGGKIRDVDGTFKGAEFRDEKTKFLFAYDYKNRIHFRVWGTTFKPALFRECKRSGVKIYDRTMATSLLNEGGQQGRRVVGATAIHVRTGEFFTFRAKATVLCLSRPQRIWQFQSELTGFDTLRPQTNTGNGHAMAFRAGAEFTLMEKSVAHIMGSGDGFPIYGHGNPINTWHPCSMVDAKGNEIPWVDRDGNVLKTVRERSFPAPGQKVMGERSLSYAYRRPQLIPDLLDRIKRGEFKLPLYADLPGLPEEERRVIWGMMVREEGKTEIPIYQTYTKAGFRPDQDLLQSYLFLGSDPLRSPVLPHKRIFGEVGECGGLVTDWNLRTSLGGLYAAGDQLFASNYHHHAATTGRYAGRKAAEETLKRQQPKIQRRQVEKEKNRVRAFTKREDGLNWKELNAASGRIMQNYCGDPKNEELLKIGLNWFKDLVENEVPKLSASDPHKLMRTLEVIDIVTCSEMILHACLARKASSKFLGFTRYDYPEMDPPAWRKFITIKQEAGRVKIGELPIDFSGPLEKSYESINKDYLVSSNCKKVGGSS